MIYRTGIYLDITLNLNKNTTSSITKNIASFKINNEYNVDINFQCSKDCTSIKITIGSQTFSVISYKKFLYKPLRETLVYSLYNLCRTYRLESNINNDIFLISIKTLNMLDRAKKVRCSSIDIENEILYTDFTNGLEMIDLCMLLFNYDDLGEELTQLFINKALYFGYTDMKSIFNRKKIDEILEDIYSKKIKIDSFYKICFLKLYYKDKSINKEFYNIIQSQYTKNFDKKLKNFENKKNIM